MSRKDLQMVGEVYLEVWEVVVVVVVYVNEIVKVREIEVFVCLIQKGRSFLPNYCYRKRFGDRIGRRGGRCDYFSLSLTFSFPPSFFLTSSLFDYVFACIHA